MSPDIPLDVQRRLIRHQWRRDAASLVSQPASGYAQARLLPLVTAPGQPLPDAPADDGEGVRTGPQIPSGGRVTRSLSAVLPSRSRGARALWTPWQCPDDLPDGQREVLQLLHGRVSLAQVLGSRHRDARALSVRLVLEADSRVGPARTREIMAAARIGDVAVSQLAPVHAERLLAAAGSLR